MSPMLPDLSDDSSDGGIEETSPIDNHSPDGPEVWIYETPESDWTDDGYGTDDDLSELEGDELEESLMRQKELEEELVRKDDKGTKDAFHTLMQCIQPQEWKNGRKLSLIDILGMQPRIQSILNGDIGQSRGRERPKI